MKSMKYTKRHNNEYEEKKIKKVKAEDIKRPIRNYRKAWEEHQDDYEEEFYAS